MAKKNFLKNVFLNVSILFHSLFRGMKSADEKTMGVTREGEITDNSIEEQLSEDGVYADLLKGEVTQEVMELRDSNYRVYRHANDYKYIGNGNVVKKENMTSNNFNVFNPDNLDIHLIQFNDIVTETVYDGIKNVDNIGDVVDEIQQKNLITIERDVFPRFLIEKYAKKVVVRKNNTTVKIDLYFSTYARQFTPTDSLFITELNNILNGTTRNSDTLVINSLEFVTSKAYGADDIMFFKYTDLLYKEINVYENDFVVTYEGYPICNGIDLTAQYRTKEMDEKYANNAMKENAIISISDVNTEEHDFNVDEAISLLNTFK